MKLRVYMLIWTLFLLGNCTSTYKGTLKKFQSGEYHTAIMGFEKALEEGKRKHEIGKINYHIAESYRLSNQIAESLPYYQEAFKDQYYTENSEFYYGYALKANGEYNKAIHQFREYIKESSDHNYAKRAKDEIENINKIQKLLIVNEWIEVKNCDLLNTEESEFSPVLYNDNLIFTSSRESEFTFSGTGRGYQDLYRLSLKNIDSCNGDIFPFSKVINLPKHHDACATFSKNGKTMIFARSSSEKKKDPHKEVDLFESKFIGGKWTEPKILSISNPKYWDSTPALSKDGRRLYFSSNRPGGFGGIDIWVATKGRKGWAKPRNMGRKINTKGNEMFPYLAESGNLYFSSDGHIGLGGVRHFYSY